MTRSLLPSSQILHYKEGEHFQEHRDYFDPAEDPPENFEPGGDGRAVPVRGAAASARRRLTSAPGRQATASPPLSSTSRTPSRSVAAAAAAEG